MDRAAQGFNQSDIVNNNRLVLLQLLCRQGVCPRVKLARQAGLKQSTVTNITAEFIRWGLVQETGFLTGSKGRRSIGISLNNDDSNDPDTVHDWMVQNL